MTVGVRTEQLHLPPYVWQRLPRHAHQLAARVGERAVEYRSATKPEDAGHLRHGHCLVTDKSAYFIGDIQQRWSDPGIVTRWEERAILTQNAAAYGAPVIAPVTLATTVDWEWKPGNPSGRIPVALFPYRPVQQVDLSLATPRQRKTYAQSLGAAVAAFHAYGWADPETLYLEAKHRRDKNPEWPPEAVVTVFDKSRHATHRCSPLRQQQHSPGLPSASSARLPNSGGHMSAWCTVT